MLLKKQMVLKKTIALITKVVFTELIKFFIDRHIPLRSCHIQHMLKSRHAPIKRSFAQSIYSKYIWNGCEHRTERFSEHFFPISVGIKRSQRELHSFCYTL